MTLSGTLGDYVFPCPMDLEILRFLSLSPEKFLGILSNHSGDDGDDGVLQSLGTRLTDLDPAQKMWCEVFLVRHSRLLDEQDREEGHS